MTDITCISRRSPAEKTSLAPNLVFAKIPIEIVREWWRRYRSRRELALLSYHERTDLGFPAGMDAEIGKPFWRK